MELRHLRYFTAVAAHGNFSRAADHLHLTQPALSRQVLALEEEIGVPLFVRGKNPLTLTDAGEVFYEDARELLAQADRAVQRARGEVEGEKLRIGYAPSLLNGILPRAIERFQRMTPKVQFALSDLSPKEMLDQISAGLLDLAVTIKDSEHAPREIQWTEVRRLATVLILPKNNPLAGLKRIPPGRLRAATFVAFDRVNFPESRNLLRAAFKPFGFSPRFSPQSVDGLASLFAALETGAGVAMLTEGVKGMLPPSLVMRPFSPALAPALIVAGIPLVRPNPHAEIFSRLLREESARA